MHQSQGNGLYSLSFSLFLTKNVLIQEEESKKEEKRRERKSVGKKIENGTKKLIDTQMHVTGNEIVLLYDHNDDPGI